MVSEPWEVWKSLFTDELKDIWLTETKKLRKVAMIVHVLEKEFSSIQRAYKQDINTIKQKFNLVETHKEQATSRCKIDKIRSNLKEDDFLEQKENIPTKVQCKIKVEKISKITNSCKSPLIFDLTSELLEIDDNQLNKSSTLNKPEHSSFFFFNKSALSDNETPKSSDGLSESPKINRRRKFTRHKKLNTTASPSLLDVAKNLCEESDKSIKSDVRTREVKSQVKTVLKRCSDDDFLDISVIDSTPHLKRFSKKIKPSKRNESVTNKGCKKGLKSKQMKSSTLTQFFGSAVSSTKTNWNKSDAGRVISETDFSTDTENKAIAFGSKTTSKNCDTIDVDATFCPDIDVCLNNLKKTVENQKQEGCEDNVQIIKKDNEASNKFKIKSKFAETYDRPTKKKVTSPKYVYQTDTVRGKERIKLQGWACAECKDYYNGLGLTDKELQEKMNQCSKHRKKFAPPPDTPAGFWNLDFAPMDDTLAEQEGKDF